MISDLFGIRITLYYQDDIEVCKQIFENTLINVRWKESESDASTFDATKNNGTFLLPGYVKKVVCPKIEGLRIKPTFELQIRTVFFEGWHEAEHDMRYKEEALWNDLPKESRKLNSVLAALEMCDQYMVTLFDDVGHDFYKSENWGQMIRYRYRLKTLNKTLDPELEKLIVPELAKCIFKWDKDEFIKLVLERGINYLDADTIVYLGNERLKGTPDYSEQIEVEYDRIRHAKARTQERIFEKNIVKLHEEKAFGVRVAIQTEDKKKAFSDLLSLVYNGWLKKEVGTLFTEEFSMDIHPIDIKNLGFSCLFIFDEERLMMDATLSHIGLDAPGKIWTVKVRVFISRSDRLIFECSNEFARPVNAATEVQPYSRPRIYADVAKQIGLRDVWPLYGNIAQIRGDKEEAFYELLESKERILPVLLITVPSEEAYKDYDSCYGQIVDFTKNPRMPEQTNLMRKVGYVCHVYSMTNEQAEHIAQKLSEEATAFQNGIRFFARGFSFETREGYSSFSEEEINDKPKDIYALRTKEPYYYQTVCGPAAVRHEVIQMVYSHVLEKSNHLK